MKSELGEPRHSGHLVRVPVVNYPGVDVYFQLTKNGELRSMVRKVGEGPRPLDLNIAALEFETHHHALLLEMLQAAQAGNFRAAEGGVSWRLLDAATHEVQARALFVAWDNPEPDPEQLRAYAMTEDDARARAKQEFEALPEATRRRLFEIAASSVG
jgi:hypothetical protein